MTYKSDPRGHPGLKLCVYVSVMGYYRFINFHQNRRGSGIFLGDFTWNDPTVYLFGSARAILPNVGLSSYDFGLSPPPPNDGKKYVKSDEKSDLIRILIVNRGVAAVGTPALLKTAGDDPAEILIFQYLFL